MSKGSYNGGSTTIHGGSAGWFSKSKGTAKPKKLTAAQEMARLSPKEQAARIAAAAESFAKAQEEYEAGGFRKEATWTHRSKPKNKTKRPKK